MRDINRIDNYIDTLRSIWKKYPDLRFNQLFLNCFRNPFDYYMEDDKSLERLVQFYNNVDNEVCNHDN